MVKPAFPPDLTVRGRVTSPSLLSKSKWACCGNTPELDSMSMIVKVNLNVEPSARCIGAGRGVGSLRLLMSHCRQH